MAHLRIKLECDSQGVQCLGKLDDTLGWLWSCMASQEGRKHMLCCSQPVRLEECCCYVSAEATLLASSQQATCDRNQAQTVTLKCQYPPCRE